MTLLARWAPRALSAGLMTGALIMSGCEVKSPEAPSWDVDLTVPLGADTIRVDDIVSRTGTLGGEDVVAYSTSARKSPHLTPDHRRPTTDDRR